MFINKINAIPSNIGFKSINHSINEVGDLVKKFNYPYNSTEGETCEIEIYRVKKLDNNNYKVFNTKAAAKITLTPDGKEVNLEDEAGIGNNEPFAYKVIRKNKDGIVVWEGADTGVKIARTTNGEYGFRKHQEPLKKEGQYQQLDENGNVIKNAKYSYNSDLFDGPEPKAWEYTLVTQNGTTPLVQGIGYLAIPDTFIPGMRYKGFNEEGTGELVYDLEYQRKMEGMVKTVSNMYGGGLAGLEYAIPELKKLGVKKLFTTPIANGDNRTSHGYYNKNNFQIQNNMGTSEEYDSYMTTAFKNGMNHVFDSTLTSEGIEGIHIAYALRWGNDAQTSRWFRLNGLKDGGICFGILPRDSKNVRHRIINAPFNYELQTDGTYKPVENKNYNPNAETYLQIYDATQVTDEQLALDKPIDMYRELKAGRELNITSSDDTVISYVFEINPKEYQKNIDVINNLNKKENKKIELNSPEGTMIAANMQNFNIGKKSNGYVAWDDNADMIKMNYGISAYDEKELQSIISKSERDRERELRLIASKETTDITVQSLKYWAEKTMAAHTVYVIQTLGKTNSAEKIDDLIKTGKLPELSYGNELTQDIIGNLINGEYNLEPKCVMPKDDVTVKALMSLPFDAIEFGENTVGVLSTSYFSNRATTDDTIGVSRFDLMKQNNPHLIQPYTNVYNKVNQLYTNELKDFAHNIIKKVNENAGEPLLDKAGNYTEYGEYVIELLGRNIAKYAFLKSLSGPSFKYKMLPNGVYTYDYENIRNATTLKALGINASNPTEEAEILQRKIKKGLSQLNENDVDAMAKSISKIISGTNLNTFRIAEAFIDRAARELDYRLDAYKDTMDMDSVRNRIADFGDSWENLIKFSQKCIEGIKSVNPHAYIVAEMTDIPDLMKDTLGANPYSCPYNGWSEITGGKFNSDPEAMTKFYNETGITSEAAYSYFFTELLTNFSKEFEKGKGMCTTHDMFKRKYDLLINTRSADFLRNLYSFIGNHDKTRSVHGLAVDMTLLQSTLIHDNENFYDKREQRKDVIRVLSGARTIEEVPLELLLNVDNLNYFRTVSSRAVAQSKLLMDSIYEDLEGIVPNDIIKLLAESTVDMANGQFLQNKTTEKMTRINIPELSSIENAVKEVANLSGFDISNQEIQTIINNAKSINFENYLVQGDFDWKDNNIGKNNKKYLAEIIGNEHDAMQYSLYTVQIARLIKEAAKNTDSADKIGYGLQKLVKTYNRDAIRKNMNDFKMYEDIEVARRKNAYAALDFRVALEDILAQAEYKSGKDIKNKEEIIATVFNSITEPAITKQAMMLSFLSAFCGISTFFAGDEYGDTGFEDKSKNPNVKNRMASRRSEMERDTLMGRIMKRNKEVAYDAVKNKANIRPLRDGTPYIMDILVNGRNRDELLAKIAELNANINNLPEGSKLRLELEEERNNLLSHQAKVAYLMQSVDGDMAITVFNADGIDHDNRVNYFKKYGLETEEDVAKFMKENEIESINPKNPYIPIQPKTEFDAILMGSGVAIPVGTVFMNADSRDKTRYIAKYIGEALCVAREDGKNIIMNGITSKNGTMVLKACKNVMFKGSQRVYNKQYNFAPNKYIQKETAVKGKNLSLIAR